MSYFELITILVSIAAIFMLPTVTMFKWLKDDIVKIEKLLNNHVTDTDKKINELSKKVDQILSYLKEERK